LFRLTATRPEGRAYTAAAESPVNGAGEMLTINEIPLSVFKDVPEDLRHDFDLTTILWE
jgi:hypothetical protein